MKTELTLPVGVVDDILSGGVGDEDFRTFGHGGEGSNDLKERRKEREGKDASDGRLARSNLPPRIEKGSTFDLEFAKG